MAMPEMVSAALPVLKSVTFSSVLVEPIPCWPKVRLAGERLTTGTGAGGLPPPPPPQADQTPTPSNVLAKNQPAERRGAMARLISAARANAPASSQGHLK